MKKSKTHPPCFLLGAFEDNTYIWLIPNSHKATTNPAKHQLRKPILLKMMKGDIIVCNALTIHAGSGYTSEVNIRFHMYLFNRALHLRTLYDVDNKNAKTLKESTAVGSESSSRFIEYYENSDNENPFCFNKTKISTARLDNNVIQNQQKGRIQKRNKRKRSHLHPELL